MNIFNRRRFLKTTSLAFSALGLNMVAPTMFQKRMEAAAMANNKKLIFIFLQGGNDGINTILPRGDAMYNTTTRPTLFIPEGEALDSGNGFAQLHPALSPIGEVYNHSSINGLNGAGNMALLHRIGYGGQSRSH